MSMLPGKSISEIIEDNTVEFFLSLGQVNGSEICDHPEVKYVFAGCGYNRIMRARFQTSAADAIVGRIVSRLDFLGIDALWYITPATTTGLSSLLERYGFVLRSKQPCFLKERKLLAYTGSARSPKLENEESPVL